MSQNHSGFPCQKIDRNFSNVRDKKFWQSCLILIKSPFKSSQMQFLGHEMSKRDFWPA